MWTYVQAYEERSWQSKKEKQQLRTKVPPLVCPQIFTFDPLGSLSLVCQHRLLHVKSLEELHEGK